ncbi:transcriptional repressor [Oscillospiraceae bacterium OttesenSCG-928-F05]|nr:transcriptional repressor [Oscillospiraceae bacterium OttesenSCG-928-F05]
MKKYSRQREAVMRALSMTDRHPTAAAIYTEVRKQIPNISLGTVYRNLGQLVENGLASKITTGDGTERFDCNPEQHDHFVCRECGEVSDVTGPPVHEVLSIPAKGSDMRIEGYNLVFHGLCGECAAQVDGKPAHGEGHGDIVQLA